MSKYTADSFLFSHVGPDVVVAVETLLEALALPLDHPDFAGTPERVARWLVSMCRAYWADEDDALRILTDAVFPSEYDQMVIVKDIKAIGICPHHLLPVDYTVHVCYIPNEDDKLVVGLSKLPRLVRFLARSPILQEAYTEKIAALIEKALKPLGVGVVVTGRHACMRTRGIEQDTPVITSVTHGALRDKGEARNEFLALL